MIIDLVKVLFIGAKDDLNVFFEKAQSLGVVQFLSKEEQKRPLLTPDIQNIVYALKALRKQHLKKPYTGIYNREEAEKVVDRILEINREIEKLEDEKSFL